MSVLLRILLFIIVYYFVKNLMQYFLGRPRDKRTFPGSNPYQTHGQGQQDDFIKSRHDQDSYANNDIIDAEYKVIKKK